jgi:hypothetical protein
VHAFKRLIIVCLFIFSFSGAALEVDALFSPHEGRQAFNRIYQNVQESKQVLFSAYSWSEKGFEKALNKALENGALVKGVIHPPLYKRPSVKKMLARLSKKGAQFKVACQKMHEKFFIFDDRVIVNSSANISNGAKSKYSENFVFHKLKKKEKKSRKLLKQFVNEFSIMWNCGKNIASSLKSVSADFSPVPIESANLGDENLELISSSANWSFSSLAESSSLYKSGARIKMKRKNNGDKDWHVRDNLISYIDSANESVLFCMNHFNIQLVADALMRAVERGVDVRLAVDNQEYRSRLNNKEMTPYFVKKWRAYKDDKSLVPPVRVKYYSHAPSPKYWYLNHHKFILIDYPMAGSRLTKKKLANTVLLTGSYNISKTAELKQFDSYVMYKGWAYKKVLSQFKNEFDLQWSLNRTEDDYPKTEVLDLFYKKKYDSYPLHIFNSISLTWNEIEDLRKDLSKVAPGLFRINYSRRDCLYFSPKTKKYFGCPR